MDGIEVLIRQHVPAHAEVETLPPSGFDDVIYRVYWNLNGDPARPNKKSKIIAIHVPYEMGQDLPNISASKHSQISSRLHQFLALKYATFDPNHNADRSTPPPVEHWIIPPAVWV